MKFLCAGDVAVDDYYQIEHLPGIDEKVNAKFLGRFLGGTTFNSTRALKRLGIDPYFVTDIANDELGSFIKQELLKDNLDIYEVQSNTEKSFFTIILLTKSGEKSILLVKGSDHDRVSYQLSLSPIEMTQFDVFFSTNLLPPQLGLDQNIIKSVISIEAPDVARNQQLFPWCLENSHTVILNKFSFQEIFKKTYSEMNFFDELARLPKSPDHTIITLGSQGSKVFLGETKKLVSSDSYQVNINDTTGAGDIFNAAYMHGFFEKEMVVEDALSYANAIASASCEIVGTNINQEVIEKAMRLYNNRKSH